MLLTGGVDRLAAACAYLLEAQYSDGHWEDFDLPVGPSDAWITAYVGVAAATSAQAIQDESARRAAVRAADWLACHRPYRNGWGYNARTGPDADSTAFALRLLRAVGCDRGAGDQAWLAERWLPSGGCATYDADDGWGEAHPEVTAVAFFELSDTDRIRLAPSVREYVGRSQDRDGSWPTYWWRTRHYSTFHNLVLAHALRLPITPRTWDLTSHDSRMVHSSFDLAFVIAARALADGRPHAIESLVEELIRRQDRHGFWCGAPNLRVTRHDAPDPLRHPLGDLFTDIHHLLTTASVVYVLSVLLSWGRDERLGWRSALSGNLWEVPDLVTAGHHAVPPHD